MPSSPAGLADSLANRLRQRPVRQIAQVVSAPQPRMYNAPTRDILPASCFTLWEPHRHEALHPRRLFPLPLPPVSAAEPPLVRSVKSGPWSAPATSYHLSAGEDGAALGC
jgi:hypothetical protein